MADNTEIPEGWVETTLGDFSDIIMGQSPRGESYNQAGEGIPFYQGITEFGERFVGIKTYTTEPTKIVPPNTILFSVRAPVGRVNFTRHEACIGRGNAGILSKNGETEFLFFLLQYIEKQIKNRSSGTVFDSISGKELKDIPIILPKEKEEQQSIARMLSSFDDKIELLREQNETLEKTAQTIFQEWFGKYKVNGEAREGTLGCGVEDELPEGWRVGKLGEIAEITSGKRPGEISNNITDTHNIPLLGASKIMGYVESHLFDGKTLVIGRVGTHGEIQKFNEKIYPSDNTLVIKSDNFVFVYLILKNIDYEKMNRGAVQPLITQTDMKNYPVIIPLQEIFNSFKDTTDAVFDKIENNNSQIQSLSKTRDELLPRLMNGEVRV